MTNATVTENDQVAKLKITEIVNEIILREIREKQVEAINNKVEWVKCKAIFVVEVDINSVITADGDEK